MKNPFIIAAVLFAAVVALGFVPSDTPTLADSIIIDQDNATLSDFNVTFNEPAYTEFDTSVPAEEPEPAAEPEKPDTQSATSSACPNCPANSSQSSASGSRSRGGRDWVLFDGDGYLVDRRAASAGDGGGFHPLRRLLGVDRRQNRRAAGCGVFGCRR